MAEVQPAQMDWTLDETADSAKSTVLAAVQSLKGRVKQSTDTYVECDFGSQLWTRLIGAAFLSRRILPKRAEVTLEPIAENRTKIRLLVRDRYGMGIRAGFTKKYAQALEETARAIRDFSQRG